MRALKILLIVLLVVLVGFMIAVLFSASDDAPDPESKKIVAIMLISIGLGIFLGIMALLYHLISFRYYRTSKRMQKLKKVPAYFVVCAILSHIYFLLISVTFLGGVIFNVIQVRSEAPVFYFITLSTLVYAIVSIIETSVLKKRIRQYKEDVFLRDEIDTIGISES